MPLFILTEDICSLSIPFCIFPVAVACPGWTGLAQWFDAKCLAIMVSNGISVARISS